MPDIHNKLTMYGKPIGSDSFEIPEENIPAFLECLKDVILTEQSHVAGLDYNLAYSHGYCYGRGSFCVKDNRVFVICNGKETYTGCNLSDGEFDTLRINYCHNGSFEMLFDYLIDGRYSEKCLIFSVGEKTVVNTRTAEELQLFRHNYFAGNDREAIKHLTRAKTLSYVEDIGDSCWGSPTSNNIEHNSSMFPTDANIYVLGEKHQNSYCTVIDRNTAIVAGGRQEVRLEKCKVSLRPHPFHYKKLKKLTSIIKAVFVPFLMLEGVYFEAGSGQILIHYTDMDNLFDVDLIANLYNGVIKGVFESTEAGIKAFKTKDAFLEYVHNEDVYALFSGCWLSDLQYTAKSEQQASRENDTVDEEAEQDTAELAVDNEEADIPLERGTETETPAQTLKLF